MANDELGFSVEIPRAVSITLVIVCAVGSAIFSGLTLGLLTLDTVHLKLMIDQPEKTKEDEFKAKQARKILPLRRDGNYLLITLLMGNVAVNSGFSIIMGQLVQPLIGFLISTVIITLFGEIIPQAVCARHGLVIGAVLAPAVLMLEWLLYPLVKPIAIILNYVLGEEIGNVYNKKQLRALFDHHEAEAHILSREEARILQGGLAFSLKRVEAVMTPLDRTYGIEIDQTLNFETATAMLTAGYSRIPVFDRSKRESIVGILFVKDLVLVDPGDEVPIRNVLSVFGRRVYAVDHDATLLSLLSEFKKGHTHLAVVRRVVTDTDLDPYYEHTGIISLEDILEEILQDEIYDEFEAQQRGVAKGDRRVVGELSERSQVKLGTGADCSLTDTLMYQIAQKEDRDKYSALMLGRIKLFDNKRGLLPLDGPEALAIGLYLSATQLPFSSRYVSPSVLQQVLRTLTVSNPPKGAFLYKRGEASDVATIILQGKIKVLSGCEEFPSIMGPWTVLGMKTLGPPQLNPSFAPQKPHHTPTTSSSMISTLAALHSRGSMVMMSEEDGGLGAISPSHSSKLKSLKSLKFSRTRRTGEGTMSGESQINMKKNIKKSIVTTAPTGSTIEDSCKELENDEMGGGRNEKKKKEEEGKKDTMFVLHTPAEFLPIIQEVGKEGDEREGEGSINGGPDGQGTKTMMNATTLISEIENCLNLWSEEVTYVPDFNAFVIASILQVPYVQLIRQSSENFVCTSADEDRQDFSPLKATAAAVSLSPLVCRNDKISTSTSHSSNFESYREVVIGGEGEQDKDRIMGDMISAEGIDREGAGGGGEIGSSKLVVVEGEGKGVSSIRREFSWKEEMKRRREEKGNDGNKRFYSTEGAELVTITSTISPSPFSNENEV